ncbi:MAG TPA: VWA domain-containing protein [Thermoanaerobaculia bacterium]|jgi:VWFA-related protein|nr:VWA domain-containing protein [Thermoanaerobaculia bacterium]
MPPRRAGRLVLLRVLGVLVVPVVLFVPSASPADPPQRFSGERTDVIAVEVPVQVVRDGQPVRGLTQADFTLWDGKTKQEITGFESVDLTTAVAAPDAPPARPSPMGRRHFLMLFDLANSEPKAIVKARDAAKQVVRKLHPSDLVAVATYSASQGPLLLLGFTSDRRQAEIALDTLGVPELVERSGDPLDLVIESITGTSTSGVVPPGGFAVGLLLEDLNRLRDSNRTADRRFQASHLADYTRSLADLGQLMANVDGRKYVVLLSEGFDSSLLVGTEENNVEAVTKIEKGQFYQVDNDARFGDTRSANNLERMLEQFRRADCVIQAVDIGGLREEGARRANGQDALFAMADQTGGELFRNWNDLSQAMAKMLERTSVTYLISFQPEVERNGAYHPIKIELKNAAGAKLSHRTGYYAPLPFGMRDPKARRFDTAEAIMSGHEGGDLAATALALPFRGVAGKAYVPVVLGINGPSLLSGVEESPATAAGETPAPTNAVLPVEIYAYALDADGTIGDFFGQTLGLDLAKVGERVRQGGIEYVGHLELAAGDWSLRVLVRNGRTGALRVSVLPVRVPAFDDGRAFLLPPLFPPSAGQATTALLLRETPRGELGESPYPFQLEGQPFVPAAVPAAPRGEISRVALFAWNLPESDVRARAQVLNAAGHEIPGGRFRLVGSESAAGGGNLLLGTFEPTDLAPGAYRLRVRLTFGEGVEPVDAEAVPFEVR